jgi:purine-binding chemotaxis protein CheW
VSALQLLTCGLAGMRIAIELRHVVQVVGCTDITRVPGMPSFVRGATNVRGRAVPVVDLAAKLGFDETAIGKWTSLLLLELDVLDGPTPLAVMVDSVDELLELEGSAVEPAPPFGTRVPPAYVLGLVKREYVVVLDISRTLSEEELTTTLESPRLPDGGAANEPSQSSSHDEPDRDRV